MTASASLLTPTKTEQADAPFSRQQLYSILAALPDPAFILTHSGRYAAIFGGSDHRYYHDGGSLIGKSIFDVLNLEKARWFSAEIGKALQSRQLHIVEYSLAGSDVKGLESAGPDHPLWFEGRVQALDFAVDGEDAVVWVASNITEKNAVENQLRVMSETDALTGLCNRRKLRDALHLQFDLFRREHIPSCVLMFDIDNFKRVNDDLGHQVGDRFLTTIAEACRMHQPATDVLARVGGDEFVVLMPATRMEQGLDIADRLRSRIMSEIAQALGHHGTISGGLSEFSATDGSGEDILKRADDGLYRSKRGGRNRISGV